MGLEKEKDKEAAAAVWGFGFNCMETKILMATILAMGIMLIASQQISFWELSNELCKNIADKFFLKDSNLHIAINSITGKLGEPPLKEEESKNKRVFTPYGNAAYLFIQMGAYRGGESTFAVVGLASKPLHVYGKPGFECEWIPGDSNLRHVKGRALKILPDWGYGRVYTVVVVNCLFGEPVGVNGGGGQLILYVNNGSDLEHTEKIVALREEKNSFNSSVFTGAPAYDYLYCGSSLYGNLSPQRMREWMAYHAKFFGTRSHFVFHDAGGVHPEVRKVLEPWIETGRVTLQDIRDQEQFDGYYHNQFLIVNDCLHRYKFMAKWTFFFDVDEFLYVPGTSSLESVVHDLSDFTQFTIEQYPVSNRLCLELDKSKNYSSEWGFEKLVFRDVKKGIRRDRKYAVQAKNVDATGVHMSVNFRGKNQHKTNGKIGYYHFHGTISRRDEPCKEFVKPSTRGDVRLVRDTPYVYDGRLKEIAASVKEFEVEQIGSVLASTAQ